MVPKSNGLIPSLTQIIPSAESFERELSEMFGVQITGLRNKDYLYLPDDWQPGQYPLRKDFDPSQTLNQIREGEFMEKQLEKFTVPIGPQHPALKEPGHFLFSVEGEIVTDAKIRLGYAHRGN